MFNRCSSTVRMLSLVLLWTSLFLGGSHSHADAWELASGWDFSTDVWLAGASRFDEQPGPQAAGHVWGDFPTNFYNLTIQKRLAPFLLEGTFGLITMLDNTMYLHSPSVSTGFTGQGHQVIGRLGYRVLDLGKNHLAAGAGYQYVQAVKRFHDLQDSGTVIAPGAWGDYTINYQGLLYFVRGGFWPLTEWGVAAEALGSPVLTNHTRVTGQPQVIEESATGLRFRFEGQVCYQPLAGLSAAVGYRYEDIYFAEPAPDSFSLAIVYSGLFAEVKVQF